MGLKKNFGWAKFGPKRLNEARGAGLGPGKKTKKTKNPINNRAEFGSRVLARGSGPGMQKPGPNPARCHSYRRRRK